jgi:hypothetical protein
MAFLSLLDNRAKPKGSRDPLGFELVWSHFGRKVIGNLTTITSSMDNFAVALIGFFWANRLAGQSEPAERHRHVRELFLRYEQLAGYIRFFGGATDIMGITRVKTRLADDSFKISLGLAADQQILSDQTSYGLWGLYSAAARDTGLVQGDDRRVTAQGEAIAMTIVQLLGSVAEDMLGLLRSEEPLDREQLNSMSKTFMQAVQHDTVREPLLKTLMEGRDPDGIQGELWRITQVLFTSGEPPPENVGDFIARILASEPSDALRQSLNDIIEMERLLVASNNVFSYCRRKDGAELAEILGILNKRYTYDHLPSRLPADKFPRRVALEAILTAFRINDASRLLPEILKLNQEVMQHRGGAPWVEIEAGNKLRVRVKTERAELAGQQDIEERWDYDYFLGSFLNIARRYYGVAG